MIAGLLEVAWAIGLKHTKGSRRLRPSVGTLAAMALSARLGCVGLIVAGIIGLKLSSATYWLARGFASGACPNLLKQVRSRRHQPRGGRCACGLAKPDPRPWLVNR